jgi:hypothetical protein
LNVYAIIVYIVMQALINILAITFLTIIAALIVFSIVCYFYVIKRWW